MSNIIKKRIFTFWEPKSKIPGYVKLCMKTWEKFLPEYEIVVLDYSNIDLWLGKRFFNKHLYKNFSLPKQADAIRCGVLEKYGGIWLDADSIITSSEFNNFVNIKSEFVIVSRHIAFLTTTPHARISKKWLKGIKRNIYLHKYLTKLHLNNIEFISQKINNWDFLGNGILNKYLNAKNSKYLYAISKEDFHILPEEKYYPNESCVAAYRNFYFNNDCYEYIQKNSNGLILLHNSWTPEKYKRMSETEFLKQNNTLSSLFKDILNIV